MMKLVKTLACASLLTLSAAAFATAANMAQPASTATGTDMMSACAQDVANTPCAGMTGAGMSSCMTQNKITPSAGCKTAMQSMKGAKGAASDAAAKGAAGAASTSGY